MNIYTRLGQGSSTLGGGQRGHDSYRPIFIGGQVVNFLWRNLKNPVFGLNLTKLS